MATFVLVHGGGHGGWCYQPVARRLQTAGHVVYAPTLSGLGDRAHQLHPGIDLDTHVTDDELTKGQAEALKLIVATTDVPIMPGFMGMGMGMGHGMGMGMMHGGMMHGEMMPGGMMPGAYGGGKGHGGGMGHGHGHGHGHGRVRIRERMGDGHWGDDGGEYPMAPDAPAAPTAPGTPEAGA